MFNFFKRSDKAPDRPVAKAAGADAKPSRSRNADFLEPLPVPEVQEGNLDSDWAMWEDSVLEQESHPPTHFADTTPSRLAPLSDADSDPFAKVSKHAP